MLHWHSFLGWGNELVICVFGYHADRYIHFWRTRQQSCLSVEWVTLYDRWASGDSHFLDGQRVFYLPFRLSCQPTHSLGKDATMQTFVGRLCKTETPWLSVDAHIKHIKRTFVHWIIACNILQTDYWHPILCFWVLSFESRSSVACWFLINLYPHCLSEKWCGPITFWCFRPAIYGI